MLVLAGAGSGKTRVLTTRITRLVRERNIPADRILAVTFTNKAAAEMRERIAHSLGGDPTGLWIGTFHSIGARLVRRYADRVGRTSGFTIYDSDDVESLIKRVMGSLNISPKEWAPRAVASAISEAKNGLVTPSEYASLARDAFTKVVAPIFARLEDDLKRANAASFDDLLTLPVQLLRTHEDIATSLAARFRYVLVDEYQDTNRAQYEFVKGIGRHGNVFVVGDDDQSIYGWRGADIKNILDFERDFPAAQVVRLEENYRSSPEILTLANAVIAENTSRRGKTLRATRPGGVVVTSVTAADDRDEAEFVVDELLTRRAQDSGRTYGEIAVLYRTNAQSRPLEDALRTRRIPYRLVGQVRFYERREIKDMIAWLRLVANPSDDEAFRRAIANPRRGIGDASLDMLAAAARAANIPLLTAARDGAELPVRGSTRTLLADFVTLVDDLRAMAVDAAVDQLIGEILDRSGYATWLRGEGPDADDRLANIRALIDGASEVRDDLEGEAGLAPLDLFLQRVALVTSADESDPTEGAVTLMTLHNAKGLEYPVVFLTGLEDGLFPLVRAAESPDALEEERRLFYVGITRAEDVLILTRAQRRWRNGETMPAVPSRFVRDLPPGLVKTRRTLRAQATTTSASAWGESDDDWGASAGARRRGTPVDWRSAPKPVAIEDESQDAPRLVVGERVKHARFGAGTIAELSGQGAQAKARIDFDDESIGRKTLMLAQANLERGWEE
jgi:DNA helicase-2/ATP-dependent DNA helicase PcrA